MIKNYGAILAIIMPNTLAMVNKTPVDINQS